jgi:hypothetical protein
LSAIPTIHLPSGAAVPIPGQGTWRNFDLNDMEELVLKNWFY